MINYNIYPSLLDAYSWYLKNERPGALKELLDKINRVETEFPEAAKKGTYFNELTDSLVNTGIWPAGSVVKSDQVHYKGFDYPVEIVERFVEELTGSITQAFVKGVIDTKYGLVELYGYTDNILGSVVIDQKTMVKPYEFPKFLHNWQHIVYPYCLNQEGVQIDRFLYLITDFESVHDEEYMYNPERDLPRLRERLETVIEFLEIMKSNITDAKIFNYRYHHKIQSAA